jgi:hypothetical protein
MLTKEYHLMGTLFDVCRIFKPNAALAKVDELGKSLAKQDHSTIAGGPASSLERNSLCN